MLAGQESGDKFEAKKKGSIKTPKKIAGFTAHKLSFHGNSNNTSIQPVAHGGTLTVLSCKSIKKYSKKLIIL
jgi:hypothetical protein